MDANKPAVPKFASFKPKAEPASEPTPPAPATHHQHRDQDRDRKRVRDHDRHSTSRQDRPHSSHRRHDRPRRPRSLDGSTAQPQPRPAPQEPSLYVVDKRGDPLIVRYKSNDRAKVPAYRRAGFGRVLGGQGRLRLLRDGPQELFSLGDRFGEGASAFRDRALLSQAARAKTRVFRLRPSQDQRQPQSLPDGDDDFISLSLHAGSQLAKEDENPTSMARDEQGPDYRSIMGKAKPRDFVDSDLESADSSDAEADAEAERNMRIAHPARKRSTELSRHVKEHPDDVGAWMELVDLQESLMSLSEQDARRPDKTQEEAKALASLRVSLLEEALASSTSKTGKEKLLLRLMREGSRVWTSKVLAKRWSEISFKDSSFALWKARLDHEKASISTFTYAGIRQMHIDRLQYLRSLLSDAIHSTLSSHQDKTLQDICVEDLSACDRLSTLCIELIYVFLLTTTFIRDAGYSELAVAAWQALLELTFARPLEDDHNDFDTAPAGLLSSFRDFWESEVPRIGEQDAQGWRHFNEAEEMPDLPEGKADAPSTLSQTSTRDVYKAWAAVEVQKSQAAALPARTLDEGTEDDPFRVVMFADLEPLFFSLPVALCDMSRVRGVVLDAFLLFCRLPPASDLDGSAGGLLHDMCRDPGFHYDSARLDRADTKRQSDIATTTTTEEGGKQPPNFTDPAKRFVPCVDVMYAGSNWFRYFDHEPSAGTSLALLVTTQLATQFGYEAIATYSMGLAYHENPLTIRKTAKSLLKKWPGHTGLYTAYAVAEWRNGNRDVARTVLVSAARQNLPDKEQLWTTWAWLDLEEGDLLAVLAHCTDAAVQNESSASSPVQNVTTAQATYTQLLKARQSLSSRREFLLSTGKVQQAAQLATTAVLLEYTAPFAGSSPSSPTAITSSRQGDIEAALSVSRTFTTDALARSHNITTTSSFSSPPSSAHIERHLQTTAHLLYIHTTRGAFRPLRLREQIQQSFLAHFPTNTVFLSLFAWAATDTIHILVTDPVRAILLQQTEHNNDLTNHLFAIQHEMHAGTVHSVRQAFERALDASVSSAHSATASRNNNNNNNISLWQSYIRYTEKYKRQLSHHQQSTHSSNTKSRSKDREAAAAAAAAEAAKTIFHRALAACPWSKDVALEAFTTLARDMESSELRAVWNTMATKGLRVCVDLEEFGDAWRKKRGHGS
ncbi:NRDE-2, necessary for RNA interference-domain-containing protein [Coniella lustricola]|uniref:NRDE-2, necessary for RNA interference-domain-containing protein n=1 Tax=Coniella lustricola TaxID=2025994 RepID=A0A2T2ZSW5_9PEZI|nr:NRDE-2, necessary for RNA interference-domain-containing protein [Coniella lustricola]